jgi:hypothetical protein
MRFAVNGSTRDGASWNRIQCQHIKDGAASLASQGADRELRIHSDSDMRKRSSAETSG